MTSDLLPAAVFKRSFPRRCVCPSLTLITAPPWVGGRGGGQQESFPQADQAADSADRHRTVATVALATCHMRTVEELLTANTPL